MDEQRRNACFLFYWGNKIFHFPKIKFFCICIKNNSRKLVPFILRHWLDEYGAVFFTFLRFSRYFGHK